MIKNLTFFSILLYSTALLPYKGNRELGSGNWGSHMTCLISAIINTEGPVLEMGSGDYSTPLLHALCKPTQRQLWTTETDGEWLSLFDDLITDWHSLIHVQNNNWDSVDLSQHWSVVFIDHRPGERRVKDIIRLRNNTDIFVVHDTETASYRYEPVLSSFKYKYVYTRYKTQTTVVSDTIDIRKLFEN